MRDFAAASRLFEDRVDRDDYFDAASAEVTKNTLLSLIDEPERKLLFLLGEPGVGKTKMLHTLKNTLAQKGDERLVVHLEEPFFDPLAFMRRLLKAAGLEEEGSLEELKARAVAHYGGREHLIMIDEAQLLNEASLEFLRILADTKAFRLLLSMHKKEGEQILARPHFKSRSHRVVEIGALESGEVGEYLRGLLKSAGLEEVGELLDEKSVRAMHRYTAGNFRQVKRMSQVLFELMEHAKAHGLRKFARPNACLLEMAAIDLELIDG
ncbi:AAA family ATPase [Hydrogenimonas sp.]